MPIYANQLGPLFTKSVGAIVSDFKPAPTFLSTFFKEVETGSKYININAQRHNELVAVDIIRGGDGTRLTFDKDSQKAFLPPLYNPYFSVTDLQSYENLMIDAESGLSAIRFGLFMQDVADKLKSAMETIKRAYEKQCAEALTLGTVSLVNGDQIDYKRKSGSFVNLGSGNYWTDAIDPTVSMVAACDFLKQTGKAVGGVFNVVLGGAAAAALQSNSVIRDRGKLVQYQLDALGVPQVNAEGGTYLGRVTAGVYTINVWAYSETYTDANGNNVPYLAANKAVFLPLNPANILNYAGVPELPKPGGPTAAKFHAWQDINTRNSNIDYGVKSAGLAILGLVDQVVTVQVAA